MGRPSLRQTPPRCGRRSGPGLALDDAGSHDALLRGLSNGTSRMSQRSACAPSRHAGGPDRSGFWSIGLGIPNAAVRERVRSAGTAAPRARGATHWSSSAARAWRRCSRRTSRGAQGDHEVSAMPWLELPVGHQLEHLTLARRELRQRVVAPAPREQRGDDDRVERRAAGRDALAPPRRTR